MAGGIICNNIRSEQLNWKTLDRDQKGFTGYVAPSGVTTGQPVTSEWARVCVCARWLEWSQFVHSRTPAACVCESMRERPARLTVLSMLSRGRRAVWLISLSLSPPLPVLSLSVLHSFCAAHPCNILHCNTSVTEPRVYPCVILTIGKLRHKFLPSSLYRHWVRIYTKRASLGGLNIGLVPSYAHKATKATTLFQYRTTLDVKIWHRLLLEQFYLIVCSSDFSTSKNSQQLYFWSSQQQFFLWNI